MLDALGVEGGFVYTFMEAHMPHMQDPQYDLDMPSYDLAKSYADGRQGGKYPEMTWEPKESLRAVAEHYAMS